MKRHFLALGQLAIVWLVFFPACRQCPDLALLPVVYVFEGDLTRADVSLDAVRHDAAGTVLESACEHTDVDSCRLPAGLYRMTFYADGSTLGSIDQVCSRGYLTGCEAEDYEDQATATITVTPNDSSASITIADNPSWPQCE